jgi:probable O-glycosylation ligase (exosortase A-associated)
MTYSWGAMLALLVGIPFVLLRSRRRGLMMLAAVGLLLVLPFLAGKEIQQRFFSIQRYEVDATAQSRVDSWNIAFAIARDHPIFGVGPRNAQLFTYAYGADMQGRTIHSQALQIMADTGFIGLVLYLSVLASALVVTRKARKRWKKVKTPEERQMYALTCGVEGSLVVFIVGSSFLALELFEMPYLLLLLIAQLPRLTIGAIQEQEKPEAHGTTQQLPRFSPAPAVSYGRGSFARPR